MTTLADIQRRVGVAPDGKWGPNTAAAIAKALGMPAGASRKTGFNDALKEILHHEGGYVNHPSDPGGMTNLGVTRATWEDWTGKRASEADMRTLTPAKVAPLYRKNYWDQLRCDDLHPALALCVFDFGVNAGVKRAARYLQGMIGSNIDGIVGADTIAKAQAYVEKHGAAHAFKHYQDIRRDYYRQLGTFKTFGKGWLRRVGEVEQAALEFL